MENSIVLGVPGSEAQDFHLDILLGEVSPWASPGLGVQRGRCPDPWSRVATQETLNPCTMVKKIGPFKDEKQGRQGKKAVSAVGFQFTEGSK